jgi:hypothetical protein
MSIFSAQNGLLGPGFFLFLNNGTWLLGLQKKLKL